MAYSDLGAHLKNQLKDALGNDTPPGPVEIHVQKYLDGLDGISTVDMARASIALSLARKLDWDYGNTAAAIAKELSSVLKAIDESTHDVDDLFNRITSSSKMGNPAKSD